MTPKHNFKFTSILALKYDYHNRTGSKSKNLKGESSYTRIKTTIAISLFLGPNDEVQIKFLEHLYRSADMISLAHTYVHLLKTLLDFGHQPLSWY